MSWGKALKAMADCSDSITEVSTAMGDLSEAIQWLALVPLVDASVNGGYVIHRDFARPLLRLVSYWRRRDKKRQRRYQWQKRKQ